ncbi:Mu-like prophage FluMu protein gp41 [Humidesulfovibrio mexicanus]|uniref:Mu-like prophage FluMu protein gp41 n=1 Tax=Humidesulfovibrio mexicanus TaxID=147047 RepID=A0A239BC96_9BACT|nr:phage tail assembly protein [Humidesulfovibrio mexicanus]SNS05540.1 Mu-like prophage FluMu protein gp41 [Humidesulfovibrio mexicanus]
MNTLTLTLMDGLAIGEDVLKEAVLRASTCGDIIEAHEESEKLVYTKEGPRLVSSPTLSGAGMLRRQIVRIGNMQGPFSLQDLHKLSPRDMRALQDAAEALDDAAAGEALSARGRDSGAGE